MAIQIHKKLVPQPNPTSLPSQVDFRQTLRSNRDREPIDSVYAMEPDHEVWFLGDDGKPTKTVKRTAVILKKDQLVLDQINLLRGPGRGPMATVQITKTITDSSGISTADVCILKING